MRSWPEAVPRREPGDVGLLGGSLGPSASDRRRDDKCRRQRGTQDATRTAVDGAKAQRDLVTCGGIGSEALRVDTRSNDASTVPCEHLTEETCAEPLEVARGRSKRDAERLLAARFPKPDVPDAIRKRPQGGSRRSGSR